MSDINVTAHGINPETGEYLSPAERKARFKKGKLKSKINPEVFRSGTVSDEKKSGGALVKSPVGSGIIKINDFKFESYTKPEKEDKGTEVKTDTTGPEKEDKESSAEEEVKLKSSLENLLESLRKLLNLKNKQNLLKDKLSGLTKKKTKPKSKSKSKSRQGKDFFGIGRKIKGTVTKVFGDIFGLFGDILSFAALNWLSDPNNKKTITKVVKFLGGVFKWIDSAVSWAVDNTLTGFSELVSPESSISTRIGGFFKLASVFFAFRWLRNPFKIVKDLRKIFKIVTRFGKFVNKTLAKPIKIVQEFIEKSLNKVLGRTFKGGLLKGVRRFILKVGGKSLFKVFKGLGRGFTKLISKIPFVGALLDFFLSVFVFKESPGRALFKSVGALLLGAIGSAIGPIGTILGGFGGDYLGGVLYDAWFGGKKTEELEEKQQTREELVSQTERKSGMSSFREDSDENAALQDSVRSSSTANTVVESMGFSKSEFDTFRSVVARIESGGKYDIKGGSGGKYDGRYQLGAAAKTDAARYLGVPDPGHTPESRQRFRKDSEMQERFFAAFTKANHTYLMGNPEYRDATSKRKLQILGYAHNQGMGGAEKWMTTGEVGADGFGTKGTKYTDEIRKAFAQQSTPPTPTTQQSTPTPTTQQSTPPTSTPTPTTQQSTPTPTPPGADKNFLKTIQAPQPASFTPTRPNSLHNNPHHQRPHHQRPPGADKNFLKTIQSPQPASFTPTRPAASPLPSMSSSRSIDKKMRSRTGGSVIPIIINNSQNNNMSTTVNSFPLNSTSITDLTPLNRI